MAARRRTASLVAAALLGSTLAAGASYAVAQDHAGRHDHHAAPALSEQHQAWLRTAIASPQRSEANRARDQYRHPYETLNFFGVRATDTVVELFPSGGWYSEILVPYTNSGGTYVAAAGWDTQLNGFRALRTANPELYRHAILAEFPVNATSGNPIVTPGTADVVLTFRNIHNLRFAGVDRTNQAFREMFAMLRPGGRLGIVEHRLPEGMDSALEESSGYMKTSSVIAFAEAAGFRLVAQSEINANPRDTHDHPGGVWALPPVLRGATDDAERARRRAIGESDRMTLLFVKPAT